MKKIICTILFLASLGVGLYTHISAGPGFAQGVIYVSPHVDDSRFFFDASAAELLEIYFSDYEIATAGRGVAFIASSSQEVTTAVIYTNAAYFNMRTMNFSEGGHPRTENSAAINEDLAWRLFGTTENVTGLFVMIDNEEFTISGVVRQPETEYTAWLPQTATTQISSLYLRPTTADPLAEYQARDMLQHFLHRNPDDYAIINTDTRFVQLNRVRNIALITGIISYAGMTFFLLKKGG